MGEIADMMLDGTLCEGCGEWMGDVAAPPGYPVRCEACERGLDQDAPPPRKQRRGISKSRRRP